MLEICVDSLESAANALEGGAGRLELCSALSDGGLTPTVGLTKAVKAMAAAAKGRDDVKVHALIRLRGGDFFYTREEVQVMADDAVDLVVRGGADGIVFGCLDRNGRVDAEGCKTIIGAIKNIEVVQQRIITTIIIRIQLLLIKNQTCKFCME